MRRVYRFDAACGQVVECQLRDGPPPPSRAPMVISDTTQAFRSMANGQFYDSKSAYRRDLRAAGYREVGNDAPTPPRPYTPEAVERDIVDSIAMIEADHPEASTSTGPRNTREPRTDGAPVKLRAPQRRKRVRA